MEFEDLTPPVVPGGDEIDRSPKSDNGDPLNGIIYCLSCLSCEPVSHGLVTVLEPLENGLRTVNEYQEVFPLPTNMGPCP